MERQQMNGILEEFRIEFLHCWLRLPNKGFFLILLAGWLALFQFLGNSTLGYAPTSSLLIWMYKIYTAGGGNLLESEGAFILLIPFVVLFLFWLKRRQLIALDVKVWWPGLLIVAFALALHCLGYLVQQPGISIISLFTGIYGLMGLAWGLSWLRASFFPFFLFGFCLPLGSVSDPITFHLRLVVSQLVELISHYVLAIDVVRMGTMLRDPSNRYGYEVAAACSGIRSLLATLALCVILGFVSCQKPWKRLLMIASAFPLAVFGNLLRMLSIIIAAEIGGQSSGDRVHDGGPFGVFSLLPYLFAFAGLLLLESYLRDPVVSESQPRCLPKAI
jgi:exosortase